MFIMSGPSLGEGTGPSQPCLSLRSRSLPQTDLSGCLGCRKVRNWN